MVSGCTKRFLKRYPPHVLKRPLLIFREKKKNADSFQNVCFDQTKQQKKKNKKSNKNTLTGNINSKLSYILLMRVGK